MKNNYSNKIAIYSRIILIFIDEEFRAGQREPRTKEEIYSVMIILGFLPNEIHGQT